MDAQAAVGGSGLTHEAAVRGPTCCEYSARTKTGAASGWESGTSPAVRCCASDRGEGRLSWWRGTGISESRPRGWLGRGRGGPEQVHGGWHALGSCGLLSSDLGGGPRKLTERYVKSDDECCDDECCRFIFRLQCRKADVVFRGELTNHPASGYCDRLRRRRGGGATMKKYNQLNRYPSTTPSY